MSSHATFWHRFCSAVAVDAASACGVKLSSVMAPFLLLVMMLSPAQADVIAFWDFNNGFGVPDDSIQIVHAASQGSGTLYQQRADTDGNGKGGVAFFDAIQGINVIDGQSIAWNDIAKTGDNDAELFAEFSTSGFTNIRLRFDVRGNGGGVDEIVSYDLKYSLLPLVDIAFPGGTIKDFSGGLSTSILNNQAIAANGSSFITESVDLSGITALNNQSTVTLRFDDFRENGAMRIDNLMITGVTAIPEPSAVAVLGMLASGWWVRRRR